MKRLSLFVAFGAASLLAACEKHQEPQAQGIRATVEVNVVADMTTRVAATADENRVETFDVLVFDAASGLLENIVSGVGVSTADAAGENTVGSVTVDLADVKTKNILAVANFDLLPRPVVGQSLYAEAMDLYATCAGAPESPFVMGGALSGYEPAQNASVSVSLHRRVCKLLVENRSADDLVIKSLALRNAAAGAYLFKSGCPDAAGKLDYDAVTVADNDPRAIYLYPSPADSRPVIDVEGTVYGRPFVQSFEIAPVKADGTAVDMENNSVYHLRLTAEQQTVTSEIIVGTIAEWSDGGEIGGTVNADQEPSGDILFNGMMWQDRNVGAASADFENDWDNAIGSFFQWGRNTPFSTSGYDTVAGPLSPEEAYSAENAGKFITRMNKDWLDPSDDTLWQDAASQPCPDGYRLPTAAEFLSIYPSNGVVMNMYSGPKILYAEALHTGTAKAHYWGDKSGMAIFGIKRQGMAEAYLMKWEYLTTAAGNAYVKMSRWAADAEATFSGKDLSDVRSEFEALGEPDETFALPAAGYITGSNGAYSSSGGGFYWTSTLSGSSVGRLEFQSSTIAMTGTYNSRVSGHSLRCLKIE